MRSVVPLPELDRLNELFELDQATGHLTSKTTKNTRQQGSRAGWVGGGGYRYVCVDGVTYRMNRIVWKMSRGADPLGEVDHRDRDNSNDAPSNLRDTNTHGNTWNRSISSVNTTGVRGVSFSTRRQQFVAQIKVFGRAKTLGRFDTLAEAAAARRSAELKYHQPVELS